MAHILMPSAKGGRRAWLFLVTAAVAFLSVVARHIQFSESSEFQLFRSDFPMEIYDQTLKFRFRATAELGHWPVKFVAGLTPTDNGNALDPDDLGR